MKFIFIAAGIAASFLQVLLLKFVAKKNAQGASPIFTMMCQVACPVLLYGICSILAEQYLAYALGSFIVCMLIWAGVNFGLTRKAENDFNNENEKRK